MNQLSIVLSTTTAAAPNMNSRPAMPVNSSRINTAYTANTGAASVMNQVAQRTWSRCSSSHATTVPPSSLTPGVSPSTSTASAYRTTTPIETATNIVLRFIAHPLAGDCSVTRTQQ